MAGKLPWFKWFADKWLSDEKLLACSLAAQGLWARMLSLMHKNDRRGYLQIAGKPVTPEQLARMTGCSADEASRLLAELLNAGVASVSEDGSVYSRLMTSQEHKRRLCSAAGKKGGGRPTFKGQPKGAPKGTPKGRSLSLTSLKEGGSEEESKEEVGEGGAGGGTGGGRKGEARAGGQKRLSPAAAFAAFWAAFPKQVGKAKAREVWKRLDPDDELVARIMAQVERQKQERAAFAAAGQFHADWKDPERWLRDRRWEDEPMAPEAPVRDLFGGLNGQARNGVGPNPARLRAPPDKYTGRERVVGDRDELAPPPGAGAPVADPQGPRAGPDPGGAPPGDP